MNIDRRNFLIGLLALTTVPVLANFNLELSEEIEKAWDTLNKKPFLFQVNSYGVLDDESYWDSPIKRKDAYDIPRKIKNMEDLFSALDCQLFAQVIYGSYHVFREEASEETIKNWIAEESDIELDEVEDYDIAGWSRTHDYDEVDQDGITRWANFVGMIKFIEEVNNELQDWLEEDVIVCEEEVYADIPLYGGAYVFNFFNSEPDLVEKLKISLVEGFYPGDNSQRAMLDIPMGEANEICRNENIPIRFEKT